VFAGDGNLEVTQYAGKRKVFPRGELADNARDCGICRKGLTRTWVSPSQRWGEVFRRRGKSPKGEEHTVSRGRQPVLLGGLNPGPCPDGLKGKIGAGALET